MDKIDTNSEDYKTIENEADPLSAGIKVCINKINEIVDWINEQ